MSNNAALFMHEFAKNPMSVASVTPSSHALAQQMTTPIPATGNPIILELGPGTGAFTREIQSVRAGRGRHIAVELNERFTNLLAKRYPDLDAVTADAGDIVAVLADLSLGYADVIVSGLPWAAFRREQQQELLDEVVDALAPDGAFTTFTYVHARWSGPARRFRRSLGERFEETVLGRTVWTNLPPALVYHCRRPRKS
jgi:phosphatidylethanolamine/phosphatidyl-N-methylethanolamine N-methyltransferase